MRTAAEWLRDAEARFGDVSETPRLDAELILAHALKISRAVLLARLKEPLTEPEALETLMNRRAKGEPLAYLFGVWEFFSLEFEVLPPVLVPRPETEHLVEVALAEIAGRAAHVLDLCTGTGCVAVSIAVNAPESQIVAADVRGEYVELASRNAARHEVSDRVSCRQGDLFDAVKHGETFDAICANPPYIERGAWDSLSTTIRDFEDPKALLAGEDGLNIVRRIAVESPRFLRSGGLLAMEIGQGQAGAVREILEYSGYADTRFVRDLAGIERIVVGRKPG